MDQQIQTRVWTSYFLRLSRNIFTRVRNAPKLDFFLSKSAALEISRLLVGSSSSSTDAAISFFIVLTLLLAIVLDLIEASLDTERRKEMEIQVKYL